MLSLSSHHKPFGMPSCIGYKNILFRHGAWLTFGNLDLHLIKGIPAVHPEDEIHVGHIAIEVGAGKMAKIRERLQKLGIKPREDASVGNTVKTGTEADQVFERSPYREI